MGLLKKLLVSHWSELWVKGDFMQTITHRFVIKAVTAKANDFQWYPAQKFFIKDFFGKCDQIPRKLRIWSHLLKKSLMESFIFFCSGISELFLAASIRDNSRTNPAWLTSTYFNPSFSRILKIIVKVLESQYFHCSKVALIESFSVPFISVSWKNTETLLEILR